MANVGYTKDRGELVSRSRNVEAELKGILEKTQAVLGSLSEVEGEIGEGLAHFIPLLNGLIPELQKANDAVEESKRTLAKMLDTIDQMDSIKNHSLTED